MESMVKFKGSTTIEMRFVCEIKKKLKDWNICDITIRRP